MKKYYHVAFIEMYDLEARVQRTVTCENGLANMENSPYVDVLDYERAYPGDDPMVDMYVEVEKVNGEEELNERLD